jgi:hypothetical protein
MRWNNPRLRAMINKFIAIDTHTVSSCVHHLFLRIIIKSVYTYVRVRRIKFAQYDEQYHAIIIIWSDRRTALGNANASSIGTSTVIMKIGFNVIGSTREEMNALQ